MSDFCLSAILSPLPGLGRFAVPNPRLTPWATFCRRRAAEGKQSDAVDLPIGASGR